MVPSKSISRSITSGGLSGGGGGAFGLGISSLTAWVMMGSVTISVTSSTSMTSISGVVLMSQKVSPEPPTLIAILLQLLNRWSAVTAHAVVGLRQEPHLDDAAALDGVHNPPDGLVTGVSVAADMNLGLRLPHGRGLDETEQLVAGGHLLVVPENLAFLV